MDLQAADRVLVDADVVSKLAHWDLLSRLPTLLHCSFLQMATVPSVPHRAARVVAGHNDKLFSTRLAAKRALAFCEQIAPLPPPDPRILGALQGNAHIDAGEALLLACASSKSFLLTGDKRALDALAHAPAVEVPCKGQILCLEQIVLMALKVMSLPTIRTHICPHREIDKSIGAAFGSDCSAGEADVQAGLRSYIEHLRNSTSGWLAPFPPLS